MTFASPDTRCRLRSLALILGATALASLAMPAGSQTRRCPGVYKILVAFSAGSINDTLARAVAQGMTPTLGQPVIVENRPGAGGSVATAVVAHAPPDGCTMGLATSSQMVANVGVYKSLPFDVDHDFAWVGLISRTDMALAASMSAPDSLKGLIADAKSHPGTMSYGSGGVGSIPHIVGEEFKKQAGIDVRHIPYKGNAQAIVDLVGRQTDFVFDAVATTKHLADSGNLRLLGISGTHRSALAPQLPTFAELGFGGFEAYTWNGLVVPAATPPAVLNRLHEALARALATPSVHEQIEIGGSDVIGPSTPTDAAAFAQAQRARWLPAIRAMKIGLD